MSRQKVKYKEGEIIRNGIKYISDIDVVSYSRMCNLECSCGTIFSYPVSRVVGGFKKHCGCKNGVNISDKYSEGFVFPSGIKYLSPISNFKSLFECHCGKKFEFDHQKIINGVRLTCGCGKKSLKLIEGDLYGECAYIKETRRHKGNRKALFKCYCGNEFESIVYNIYTGKTKSCGCLAKKVTRDRSTTHGMAHTPEFKIWAGIKFRVFNKNCKGYKDYGERGINMCETWVNSFENFYRDMGSRPSNKHSIDRIDNNKGYSKENCMWADIIQQNSNKRTNIFIEYNNKRLTIGAWAKEIGVSPTCLYARYKAGWSVENMLNLPPDRKNKIMPRYK